MPDWINGLTLMQALFIYGVGSLADLYTTKRALAAGGYEANPVMRWCMGLSATHPMLGVLLNKTLLGVALYVYGNVHLVLGGALLYLLAAAWNFFGVESKS